MKFRYLIGTLLLGLGIFAACEEEKPEVLAEIQVSESYLSIGVNGGSATTKILTADSWSVDPESVPEWLTVSPMSGGAGESTLTFSASETKSTNKAEVVIKCAGKSQYINVIQFAEKTAPKILTVAEALAIIKTVDKGDGQSYNVDGEYYFKGIVCRIIEISPQYGNATFWMSDDGKYADGKALQVYRGAWINGAAFTKGDEFAVGDELTIAGNLMSYKGTPETVEKTAWVVEYNPSLIKVEKTTLVGGEEGVTVFPLEGGSIKVELSVKGNGFHVSIPDEAKTWLHIDDFGGNYVTLSADPNPGGDRNAVVSFSTEAEGVTYSCEQTFSQKGAIVECPIADFLAAEVGDTQYRLTGVITEDYAADSQGQSFTIRDWSGETLVYRLDDYKASGAQPGDVITVVGKRGAYKDSPQMVSGVYESHLATVKDKKLAEIAAAADATDVYYIATGTIKEIANETYGNVWLTDDSGELYVYGCYPGWGATGDNRKNFFATAGIKVGDKLSVIGIKSTHNDAPQISNGIYFKHEEGGTPGPEPQGSITVDGNASDWDNVKGVASASCPAGAELGGIKSAKVYYGDKLYILAEFSDEALAQGVADGKLRFHVYVGQEGGLLARQWVDENIAYMLEGKATSGGAYCELSSPWYKFTGETSADWAWADSGATPTITSAGSGNFYEVAIDYSNYPGGFPEQVEIGIDCADGNYAITGYAPQTSHKFTLKKGEVIDRPDGPDPGAVPATIAEIIASIPAEAVNNDTAVQFEANLASPAVVSYVNGNNAYIQDETGAILLYKKDHGLEAGNTVSGKLAVKAYWYNGIPEMVEIGSEFTKGSGSAPAPKALTVSELLANYDANLLRLIVLKGVTVTGGIADGDRNGEIEQGGSKINVYAQLNNKGLVLTEGETGDLVTIPGYYKETKQVYLWDNSWFTAGGAPAQVNISIDGDMSDWAAVARSAEPDGLYKAFKVFNDSENFYFYMATEPGSRLWSGGAYHYLYFDFDNNASTGAYSEHNSGDQNWEAFIYLYLFNDDASNPQIFTEPEGDAKGMTMENIKVAGIPGAELVEIEISIPRANFSDQVKAGDVIRLGTYRSKDGGKVFLPDYVVL